MADDEDSTHKKRIAKYCVATRHSDVTGIVLDFVYTRRPLCTAVRRRVDIYKVTVETSFSAL